MHHQKTYEAAAVAKSTLEGTHSVYYVEPINTAAVGKKRKRDPSEILAGGSFQDEEETDISVLYIGGLDISFTSRHLPPLLEVYSPLSALWINDFTGIQT